MALGCASPFGSACAGGGLALDTLEARRLHVRVLLVRGDDEERHELVLELRPGRVDAVGLTPMGTEAYRLRHDADGLHVESRVGRFLGLSPKRAYDAVVRSLAGSRLRDAPSREIDAPDCGYRARVVPLADGPLSEAPPARSAPPPH